MDGDINIVSEITPQLLLKAYTIGIFPMSDDKDDPQIFWVEPDLRGILPFEKFHLPRSLKKAMRQNPFEVRVDTSFSEVMRLCAEEAPDRKQTWINQPIMDLYCELHKMGYAHSVECWQDDILVGGLYGVRIGAAFFGESMFSRKTNASKIALAHLVHRLNLGGFQLLDTQFTTPHLERFGVIEIPKDEYSILLESAVHGHGEFYPYIEGDGYDGGGTSDSILQSLSQIS